MDGFTRPPKRRALEQKTPARTTLNRVEPRQPKQPPVTTEPFGELPTPKLTSIKSRFSLPKPHGKLQWGLFAAACLVLLSGASYAVYAIFWPEPEPIALIEPTPTPEPEPAPEPTTIASRMSGREIDKNTAIKPIYAVQIENSPEARPQSGLREADIISEAIAEGGITRFNALFHDNIPQNVGPIRSLRPYYIDWFLPYNAPIVHAGGSAEALSDIRTLRIQDMDNTAGYFRRVNNRYAPHNLYSTGPQLLELFTARGYKNADPIPSLPRKVATPAETPTASVINLKISSTLYNVVFTYDKTSNSYLRNQGGSAHVDAESGQQLAPNVVIVPILTKGIHPNRVNTQYGTVGSGEVFVFQDGIVTKGTWTKSSRSSQWQLTDTNGAVIALNPGQTWFSILDKAASVTYQ
jgi:hypothetical protein